MHLETGSIYCLPDNYEVRDASLLDIQQALHPRFDDALIRRIAHDATLEGVSAAGTRYLPGLVPIPDLGHSLWLSAAAQLLFALDPLRDMLLQPQRYDQAQDPVLRALGELCRRVHWPRLLRPQASAHELAQAVSRASGDRFRIGREAEVGSAIVWLVNTINRVRFT
jgi:U4/U6.U5 tri-snRNP-associated protein 2